MASRRIAVFLGLIVVVVGAIGAMGTVGGTTTAGMETAPGSSVTVDLSDPVNLEAADDGNVSSPITSDNPNLELEFEGGYAERFIVEGYRDGRLGPVPDVRVGETLRLPIRVTNIGDTAETYSLTLVENGADLDVKTGTLDPSEKTVVEFEIAYDALGEEYSELELADWSTIVWIYDEESMVVTDLSVSKSTVKPDETVTVTATIENGDTASTESVEIWNHDEIIHSETLSLDAGETTTIETVHTVEKKYGAMFSVNGSFVTGYYEPVKTEWDPEDTDWKINDSDTNFSGMNESAWDFNDSDLNVSESNESVWDFNDSNGTFNDSDWGNESWENDTNWEANDSEWSNGTDDTGYEAEGTSEEAPGFGIGAMMVAGVTLTVLLRRRL